MKKYYIQFEVLMERHSLVEKKGLCTHNKLILKIYIYNFIIKIILSYKIKTNPYQHLYHHLHNTEVHTVTVMSFVSQ